MTEFERIIAEKFKQREADEMEARAAAGATLDILNARLAGLPPEGEWQS